MIVERCSFAPSQSWVTHAIPMLSMRSPTSRGQFDVQVFNDLSFVENTGAGE